MRNTNSDCGRRSLPLCWGSSAVVAGPVGSARADGPAPAQTVGDITGFAADGPVYRLRRRPRRGPRQLRDRPRPSVSNWPRTARSPTRPARTSSCPRAPRPHTQWRDDGATPTNSAPPRSPCSAYKSPLRFELRRADGTPGLVRGQGAELGRDDAPPRPWRAAPTSSSSAAACRTGAATPRHRGQTIEIAVNYNWDDGGHPNSVPFYLSTAGYGVFRNTFAPGPTPSTHPVTTAHEGAALRRLLLRRRRQGRHRPATPS